MSPTRSHLPSSSRFTVTHSTSCNRIQSLHPCCLCLPSFCHRSLAEIVHSLSPAAHRKECRQSRCQFHQGEVPKRIRKAFIIKKIYIKATAVLALINSDCLDQLSHTYTESEA